MGLIRGVLGGGNWMVWYWDRFFWSKNVSLVILVRDGDLWVVELKYEF